MSAPQPTSPAFLRAAQLARYLGLSRAHLYKHILGQLTKYPAGGRVVVYSTAEAVAFIKNGRGT
jgi:hypothetical protein